ncbi:MAG TPA: DUF2971 domain-containing protein [Fulvivirga sp.]|nr:DUF2971 domain-containing protein [Fulvivirga sp.]
MTKKLGDFKLPDTLYKFRDWNNKYHRELLHKQIAFFASPKSFNDPFDCKIPIRYDIEPERQLEDIYYSVAKACYPNASVDEIRNFAKKQVIEGSISPTSFKKNDSEYFKNLDSRMGIFSLTQHNDDILMWGHYANAHSGFCVGFDSSELLKIENVDYLGKVGYHSDFPTILPKGNLTENFEKQIFSKWDKWSYEDEFRLTKNHIDDRKIMLPKKAFKEIILGYNMNLTERRKLIQLVNKKHIGIKIYEAKPHKDRFKIEISRIN